MGISEHNKAREVVIVEHFDPQNLAPGGIDSIIHDLVKYSEGTQFRIIGITTTGAAPIGNWLDIEFAGRRVQYFPSLQLDRLKTDGLRTKLPHSLLFAFSLLRFRKILPSGEYHTHRIETGLLISLITQSRLIQFIHNDSSGLLGAKSDSAWRRIPPLYRFLERKLAERADKMVLFNKSDSARLRVHRRDLIVSRTWFDSDLFTGPTQSSSADGSETKICWVGRLDQQKDPLLALEVVKELKMLGKKPRLTMIGEGALGNIVRNRVVSLGLSQEVEMAGSRSRPHVASAMAEHDVLLMTSRYEGSPVVLLEAGASGLPVVATQESDPDKAIILGVNGVRVDSRDARELALAIIRSGTCASETCRQLAETRSGRVSVPALLASINA